MTKILGQEWKGLVNGPNWNKWRWSDGQGRHIGKCRVLFKAIWWLVVTMHSLERWKVCKLCTFLGDILRRHDAFRQKVPTFTLEIQAYRWPTLNFWNNLVIFHPKKIIDMKHTKGLNNHYKKITHSHMLWHLMNI